MWHANNVMARAIIIWLQPVVLECSVSDSTSWYKSSANVSVLLRKVSASPLSQRQSNRTQLLCILSGKPRKLWLMQSLIFWSRHNSEIWSLSAPPTHQESTVKRHSCFPHLNGLIDISHVHYQGKNLKGVLSNWSVINWQLLWDYVLHLGTAFFTFKSSWKVFYWK